MRVGDDEFGALVAGDLRRVAGHRADLLHGIRHRLTVHLKRQAFPGRRPVGRRAERPVVLDGHLCAILIQRDGDRARADAVLIIVVVPDLAHRHIAHAHAVDESHRRVVRLHDAVARDRLADHAQARIRSADVDRDNEHGAVIRDGRVASRNLRHPEGVQALILNRLIEEEAAVGVAVTVCRRGNLLIFTVDQLLELEGVCICADVLRVSVRIADRLRAVQRDRNEIRLPDRVEVDIFGRHRKRRCPRRSISWNRRSGVFIPTKERITVSRRGTAVMLEQNCHIFIRLMGLGIRNVCCQTTVCMIHDIIVSR